MKPMWFQNESDESTPGPVQATKKRPDGATCVFLSTWAITSPLPVCCSSLRRPVRRQAITYGQAFCPKALSGALHFLLMLQLEKVVGLTGFVIIHVFIASFSPAQGERNQMVNTKFTRPVNEMPMSNREHLHHHGGRQDFLCRHRGLLAGLDDRGGVRDDCTSAVR